MRLDAQPLGFATVNWHARVGIDAGLAQASQQRSLGRDRGRTSFDARDARRSPESSLEFDAEALVDVERA